MAWSFTSLLGGQEFDTCWATSHTVQGACGLESLNTPFGKLCAQCTVVGTLVVIILNSAAWVCKISYHDSRSLCAVFPKNRQKYKYDFIR